MCLEYRPPDRPQFGGHIERYLGCEFSHLMSTSDRARPSHRRIQMPSHSDFQYIAVRRQLRTMMAVDIIKQRPRRQLTFIVSEIFILSSMAVLALGLPAVRQGKLTTGAGRLRRRAFQLITAN
jgi:hypothetical protein